MLALGVSADWLTPSLRPKLTAAVGRNVDWLLNTRSPGARLSTVFLTKVKSSLTHETLGNPATISGGPRRRLIPPRTKSEPADTEPVAEDITDLLGPLEKLESASEPVGLTTNSPTTGRVQPIFAIGGSGALPAIPIGSSNPQFDTVPLAPVPEPDVWLSMLVGFGILSAILRRSRSMNSAVSG
jgi:hypothetical protein